MMSLRRLRFCDLSRNSIAAQRTRLKRMRLIRWMMIGELMSSAPAIIVNGLAKRDSIVMPLSSMLASRQADR